MWILIGNKAWQRDVGVDVADVVDDNLSLVH